MTLIRIRASKSPCLGAQWLDCWFLKGKTGREHNRAASVCNPYRKQFTAIFEAPCCAANGLQYDNVRHVTMVDGKFLTHLETPVFFGSDCRTDSTFGSDILSEPNRNFADAQPYSLCGTRFKAARRAEFKPRRHRDRPSRHVGRHRNYITLVNRITFTTGMAPIISVRPDLSPSWNVPEPGIVESSF